MNIRKYPNRRGVLVALNSQLMHACMIPLHTYRNSLRHDHGLSPQGRVGGSSSQPICDETAGGVMIGFRILKGAHSPEAQEVVDLVILEDAYPFVHALQLLERRHAIRVRAHGLPTAEDALAVAAGLQRAGVVGPLATGCPAPFCEGCGRIAHTKVGRPQHISPWGPCNQNLAHQSCHACYQVYLRIRRSDRCAEIDAKVTEYPNVMIGPSTSKSCGSQDKVRDDWQHDS